MRVMRLILLLLLLGASDAQAQAARDRVVVMVDRTQPAALQAARLWAERLLFPAQDRLAVMVVPFATGMAGAVSGAIGSPADRRTLSRALAVPDQAERRFDPEPALGELAAAPDLNRVALLVVVVAGDARPLQRMPDPAFAAHPGYAALAAQVPDWLAAGATEAEMVDYFAPYHALRQGELMSGHAARLRTALEGRVVVWDVSGKAAALGRWASAAGGRSLVRPVDGEAQVAAALDSMLATTAPLLGGQAPSAPSPGTDDILNWGIAAVMAVLAVAGGWLWRRRRPVRPLPAEPPALPRTAAAEPTPLSLPPIEFKARIPAGALLVHWVDAAGRTARGNALSLTPAEVEFAVEGGVPAAVERLVCPSLGVCIEVNKAELKALHGGVAQAVFRDFRNGIDDRMALIDLITRLGEM